MGIRGGIGLVISLLILSGCSAFSPSQESNVSPGPAESNDAEQENTPLSPYKPELSQKFSEPWPTEITRVELANSAIYNAFKYLDTLGDSDCKIKAIVFAGEPVLDEHKPLLEEVSNKTISTFCAFMDRDIFVIGGSYDFVEETIAKEKIQRDFFKGCQRPAQESSSACAYDDIAWTGVSLGGKKRGEVFLEERRVTIAAHEIFHLVHDQMDPDPGGQIPGPDQPNFRPVWLNEGAGEMLGRLLPYYFGLISAYGTFIPTDRYGGFLEKDYLGDLSAMEIRQRRADGIENYYSGQLAMEYIIASVGMESLMNIWLEMGKGNNFENAFEKATGLKKKEFYKLFKQMHGNLFEGNLATN